MPMQNKTFSTYFFLAILSQICVLFHSGSQSSSQNETTFFGAASSIEFPIFLSPFLVPDHAWNTERRRETRRHSGHTWPKCPHKSADTLSSRPLMSVHSDRTQNRDAFVFRFYICEFLRTFFRIEARCLLS